MIVSDSQDHSFSQKMQRCQDYIDALQGERQKILVFQRELPLCLELVTQAIEACKQQLSETTTTTTATATAADCMHAQSECNSEQTTSDGPVFEEFIPIKGKSCSDDDEQESQKSKSDNENCNEKSDWLGSAQLSLWNQSSDPVISPRKVPVTEVRRSGGAVGAFHPFKREKVDRNSPTPVPLPSPSVPAAAVAAASSTADVVGKKKDEKDDQGQRKARRCWSPELHRRFLQALQQLGGSHVATPKQIRDLMKVDGLTNDEVKSHLQKYRLHTRRPTPSLHNSNNNHNNPQAPQFVVVGGIWVQPPEYASGDPSSSAAAAASGTRNGVYAPIATPAVPRQQTQRQQPNNNNNQSRSSHSDERGSHSGDSNSPANSSSTHTTAS